MTIETAVFEFLKNDLGKEVRTLGADDSLLESGTIDSVGIMQLVAFLERTYGVTIDDDELTPDNFDSIAAIAAFVARRKAGASD